MAAGKGRPPSLQTVLEEMALESLTQCRERAVVSIEDYRRAKDLVRAIASAKSRAS